MTGLSLSCRISGLSLGWECRGLASSSESRHRVLVSVDSAFLLQTIYTRADDWRDCPAVQGLALNMSSSKSSSQLPGYTPHASDLLLPPPRCEPLYPNTSVLTLGSYDVASAPSVYTSLESSVLSTDDSFRSLPELVGHERAPNDAAISVDDLDSSARPFGPLFISSQTRLVPNRRASPV